MNEMLELIKTRRSVRAYQRDMVPRELIDQIVEAGLYAPSGMNRQPVIIIAVSDPKTRDALSRLNASIMGTDGDPFYGAPVVLIVLADRSAPTYLYDGALAMENLMLAAHASGLGSCWIHRAKEVFDTPRGKELLQKWGVPNAERLTGVGHCILGYPAPDGEKPAAPRKEGYVTYVR